MCSRPAPRYGTWAPVLLQPIFNAGATERATARRRGSLRTGGGAIPFHGAAARSRMSPTACVRWKRRRRAEGAGRRRGAGARIAGTDAHGNTGSAASAIWRCWMPSVPISRPESPWSRHRRRDTPIPPPCSRLSAAAGGIVRRWPRRRRHRPTSRTAVSASSVPDFEPRGRKNTHDEAHAHHAGLCGLAGRRAGARQVPADPPLIASSPNTGPPDRHRRSRSRYLEWQPQITSVGTLTAVRGVDVTTEVAGLVREVEFKSGQDVQVGAGAGAAQCRLGYRATALAGSGSRAGRHGASARHGPIGGAGASARRRWTPTRPT